MDTPSTVFGISATIALAVGAMTVASSAPPRPAAPPPDTVAIVEAIPDPPVPVDSAAAEEEPRGRVAFEDSRWGRGPNHPAFDPAFARQQGWPVAGPAPLEGALLPRERIVAFYGHPNSTRMGVLGEYPPEEMLRRLRGEVAKWEAADPSTPVRPALHMVAVVAHADPGSTGDYRGITGDATVREMLHLARQAGAVLFVDLQVGLSDLREILPRMAWILEEPDVHLGIDPEFSMKGGHRPGTRIGSYDAADINYASAYLAEIVREHDLPPKVFVIHRFTAPMVTNAHRIELRPEVQVVMHMDGFGAPWLKRDSYTDFIIREPVQFAGIKLFYKNDRPLLQPEDLLLLHPTPVYIQYQ